MRDCDRIAVPVILPIVVAAFLGSVAQAVAQPWPTRPTTLVVPFAAGGGSDVIARILADALRMQLGQSVVVENARDADGRIGWGEGHILPGSSRENARRGLGLLPRARCGPHGRLPTPGANG
jgi:hypothetical protein